MSIFVYVVPLIGAIVGLAAAYGTTRVSPVKRMHFVSRDNLQSELAEMDIEVHPTEECIECGAALDPEEIGAVVSVDGDYRVVGNRDACLDMYDLG